MSTEINLDELYNNSVKILTDLIGFRTISGEDNSALINYCEKHLHKLGATSFKTFDKEKKRVNLFATLKAKKNQWYKTNNFIWTYRYSTSFKKLEYRSIQSYCKR